MPFNVSFATLYLLEFPFPRRSDQKLSTKDEDEEERMDGWSDDCRIREWGDCRPSGVESGVETLNSCVAQFLYTLLHNPAVRNQVQKL